MNSIFWIAIIIGMIIAVGGVLFALFRANKSKSE